MPNEQYQSLFGLTDSELRTRFCEGHRQKPSCSSTPFLTAVTTGRQHDVWVAGVMTGTHGRWARPEEQADDPERIAMADAGVRQGPRVERCWGRPAHGHNHRRDRVHRRGRYRAHRRVAPPPGGCPGRRRAPHPGPPPVQRARAHPRPSQVAPDPRHHPRPGPLQERG